ncbi:MAG: dTDP-glucose 4,6-dehydratase [Frankiaceae bacterium]
MRVLVAGGAGFIGSCYVRTLLAGGYESFAGASVTVLDRLPAAGARATLAPVVDDPRLCLVEGDIADERLLAGLVPGHDVVVNFAAETHVDRSIHAPRPFVHSNLVGLQALLHACVTAEVGTVLQVSSDEVYGPVESGWCAEDAPLAPSSPYAASKAGGDLLAAAYRRTYGLDVRITRGVNTYGPYQCPDKLVPLFVTRLLDGREVPLYGDGLHVRDWMHVADHCRAVQLVIERGEPGGTYNVGAGRELTNRELATRLLAACGAPADLVRHVEDRPGHDRRYGVDRSKIARLGHAPAVDLDEGLAATVRWYAARRDWWEPLVRSMSPPRRA